jgi:hypothetical protein
MIISKYVEIKVSKTKIKEFKELGFDVKLNDVINLPIQNLSDGSYYIIEVMCDVCNKIKNIKYQKYTKNIKNGGFYACSSKCAQSKVKNTSTNKFGSEYYTQTKEYKERIEQTSYKKYNVRHHVQSEDVINKMKNTNVERYGVENPFACNEIKDKIKKTNMQRYGVENPSKNSNICEKINKKRKKWWNEKCLSYYNDLDVISYNNENIYTIICDNDKEHTFTILNTLLNNRRTSKTTLCTICNPSEAKTFSGHEVQIRNFIESFYKGDIIYNSRELISPYELDIYLPELKIAIEYNGLYWHNELRKDKSYHLKKHNLCKEVGIDLFQIFEDDWKYKNEIIKSILKNKISNTNNVIYARKCSVKEIPHKEAWEFLNKNHLQGSVRSKINIGLYLNDDLVSIICLGGLRKSLGNKEISNNKYELLRYCNKINNNIIGGFSKMLNYFRNNYYFDELITYYDKSFGYKNLYKDVGFTYISDTKPNYHYIVDGIRRHRYEYRKDRLVKNGFDSNKTESEIMLERGIYKIYNSGNIKYVLKIHNLTEYVK